MWPNACERTHGHDSDTAKDAHHPAMASVGSRLLVVAAQAHDAAGVGRALEVCAHHLHAPCRLSLLSHCPAPHALHGPGQAMRSRVTTETTGARARVLCHAIATCTRPRTRPLPLPRMTWTTRLVVDSHGDCMRPRCLLNHPLPLSGITCADQMDSITHRLHKIIHMFGVPQCGSTEERRPTASLQLHCLVDAHLPWVAISDNCVSSWTHLVVAGHAEQRHAVGAELHALVAGVDVREEVARGAKAPRRAVLGLHAERARPVARARIGCVAQQLEPLFHLRRHRLPVLALHACGLRPTHRLLQSLVKPFLSSFRPASTCAVIACPCWRFPLAASPRLVQELPEAQKGFEHPQQETCMRSA